MSHEVLRNSFLINWEMDFVGWGVVVLVSTITLSGCLLLYSAAGGIFQIWANKHMYTFLMFGCFALSFNYLNIRLIYRYSYHIYFFCLLLLILAELVGYTAMGAQRWLRFGTINIQPSEIMKVAMILVLARYFHNAHSSYIRTIRGVLWPTTLILIPLLLIVHQPNLGIAFITLCIGGMMFFAAGVRIWKFIVVFMCILTALPIMWNNLHDYQKKRVLTFLHPEEDVLGAGYNIMQSEIAIGSGGVHGKGFLQGPQTQLSFLPEKHTDFIFTLLAEEFGFIGVLILLALYFLLIGLCCVIALNSSNYYGRMIAIGVASMLFIYVIVNVAMVAGILPVVGTPLPLLSYGRSNLSTMLISFGLVLNVNTNKKQILRSK
ncbi:Peptidoglycan glycosyltransferase MrdB [Alphaproteobacteria bacterium]